ncbi:MAG TPA: hypothetical protein VMB52_03775 [Verrucomicrobiae bacterium]|nr:hypothetical protein [Verrucomicrobiae bacterium]
MILTGPRIEEEVRKANITIEPFSVAQVNPNSYDFRLGDTLKVYKNRVLDVHKPNEVTTITIPESGYILQPDTLYLGHTVETIGSDVFVPIVRGKSSTSSWFICAHYR